MAFRSILGGVEILVMLRRVVVRNRWAILVGAGDRRRSDRQDGRGVVISLVWGVLTSVRVLGGIWRDSCDVSLVSRRGRRGRRGDVVGGEAVVGRLIKTLRHKEVLKIESMPPMLCRRRRNKLRDICT